MESAFPTLEGDLQPVSAAAYALRAARIIRGDLRHYTGICFPKDRAAGCELTLRRLGSFAMLAGAESDLWIDVLDDQGSILQSVPINREGFEHIRRKWKFKREKGAK